jgi:hypothetical protein
MMTPDQLERLWTTPTTDAVAPRLVGPLQGSHERLLPMWRGWSSVRLGRDSAASVARVVDGAAAAEMVHALARLRGIVLWEREQQREMDVYAAPASA